MTVFRFNCRVAINVSMPQGITKSPEAESYVEIKMLRYPGLSRYA